jgi:(2R)-3-sulfolactate dehydrogenase (NADP+)
MTMASPPALAITLREIEIVTIAAKALEAHGASATQAAALARGIAAAEADGLRSHGLMYMPIYCGHLDVGKVLGKAEPIVSRPAAGVVRVDAGSGFAHAAIDAGMPVLIEAARAQGIASLTLFNSYNCGVLGQHTEAIARAGFVALGFTNAPASIAPWGAKKPVLGTNPWSLAVPDGRGGAAFVIDQSASVVAKSEVMKRAKAGEALPVGWALDADGKPTTDSAVALKGTMMPSGGYKGVGSAILVEVMAACLAGATPGIEASTFGTNVGGPPKTGQCFIAINPDATSGGAFAARMATVLKALTVEAGTRLPGEKKKSARAASTRDGIAVDRAMYDATVALAGGIT